MPYPFLFLPVRRFFVAVVAFGAAFPFRFLAAVDSVPGGALLVGFVGDPLLPIAAIVGSLITPINNPVFFFK